MYRPNQTPHVTVYPACLSLHGSLILKLGTFEIGLVALNNISKTALGVGVFHGIRSSPVLYTSQVIYQLQNIVELIRVFFTC